MWHKSNGDGVLNGAMARLLKVAAAAYIEELRGSDCWDDNTHDQEWIDRARENWLNVAQVKRMEHGQRLHMIASVIHALLEQSIAAPELTADSEATVYQIYQFLRAATDIEHDMFDGMQTRPQVPRGSIPPPGFRLGTGPPSGRPFFRAALDARAARAYHPVAAARDIGPFRRASSSSSRGGP